MSGSSFGSVTVGALVVAGLVFLVALATLSWHGRSRRAGPVVFGGLLVLMLLLGVSLIAVNVRQTRHAQALQLQRQAEHEVARAKAEMYESLRRMDPSLPPRAEQTVVSTTSPQMILDVGAEADSSSHDKALVVSGESERCACGWLSRFRPGSMASYLAHGGAFAALLILAYVFLDARRHGRYTWPLRLCTVVLFVGICVVLR